MRWGAVLAVAVAAICVLGFPGAASAQDDGPDGEVVALLQQLIRTNTSNPPGNEQQVAELLQQRLAPLGFETEIVPTPTPGKAHLIARLRAAEPDRQAAAAGRSRGRRRRRARAVDASTRSPGSSAAATSGAAARWTSRAASPRSRSPPRGSRAPSRRSSATSSCSPRPTRRAATTARAGSPRTTTRRSTPASRSTRAAGCFEDGGGAPRLMSVTTIDKNSLSVTLKTRGNSTHSSRPLPDSALARLTRALNRIERYEPPTPKLSKTAEALPARLAPRLRRPQRARRRPPAQGAHREAAPRSPTRRLARGTYGELFNGLLRNDLRADHRRRRLPRQRAARQRRGDGQHPPAPGPPPAARRSTSSSA